ncbi:MAG: efflux RND transporter permease subunit [Alphaproteobacteria bacterium]|nr:efflux RND transporter permease subunit [Alphaproteobacteria bacterium]
MLKFFVKRPVTTVMFVLLFVVLGIVSYPKMNIERTPALDFPMVTATFVYPGAAPAEIESQVVKKAEDAISQVSELKKITSQAFENGGYVMAEFNLGINVNDKASEVKSKIDALASEFPQDLRQPVIEKLNPLQTSVVDIAVHGTNLRDLQEYTENVLANKLTSIKGVASVSIFGGEKRAIRVALNPEPMAAKGVTIMDVITAMAANNINVPGGKLEFGSDSSAVRFIGEFETVDAIKNMNITTAEGQTFRLGDVATVTDSARDLETGARFNGDKVVIASVIKGTDGNAIRISRALNEKLGEYNADLQSRFPDASMEIISDSSVVVSNETRSTINGIVLGVVFTILVLLAFTRNWRSTIIAGVVIPASLVAGLFFVNASGFTINAMTLLAYSSALGTLVSNAIILIESALQEMRVNGKSPEDAAIDGTKNVAVSVLAGVGTNVVVFLPLAFMSGVAGKFMMQFGMTVVYLTLLSLLFSFTLAPMMIAKILRLTRNKGVTVNLKKQSAMEKWFVYQYKHSGRVILMAVLVLFASSLLMRFTGNEFSPSTDANEINITARAPMGTTYEKSDEIATKIENALGEFQEVKTTSVKIGERGTQNIAVKVKLVDREKRRRSDKEIARQMLPRLNEIPDVEIQIRAGEGVSSAISSDIVLNILGPDDARRGEYANAALNVINNIQEVQTAVVAQQKPANEIRFVPNQDQMNFWGIKNSYAGTALRAALYGHDTYKYKEGGEEYPIVLEFARPFKGADLFSNVLLNSQKGMVQMSELGSIETVAATPDIRRLNKNRVTEIDINLGKSTSGVVQAKIVRELDKFDWKSGYGYEFGGMAEIQSETTSEIGTAFLLATVLTFMLLAAILNSLIHPLTIATSIITSFAGVFILLFLSGASTNVGAMLAFVMLVGLVVNNNILVLEPTIRRVNRGQNARVAMWTELNAKKNMVLMTSIAVMAGMLPQLWSADGMKVAMAAVMIGGMAASLIWTFTLTPALFFAMERLRRKLKGQKC